jgi:hypothetical protein
MDLNKLLPVLKSTARPHGIHLLNFFYFLIEKKKKTFRFKDSGEMTGGKKSLKR